MNSEKKEASLKDMFLWVAHKVEGKKQNVKKQTK